MRDYPWDEWLDGRRHVLQIGIDFDDVSITKMRALLQEQAIERGLVVRTRRVAATLEILPRDLASLYPWDEWLDGEFHQIKQSVDFHGGFTATKDLIKSQASRRGLDVQIRVRLNLIEFRALPVGRLHAPWPSSYPQGR